MVGVGTWGCEEKRRSNEKATAVGIPRKFDALDVSHAGVDRQLHTQFNIETVIVISTLGAYFCVFVLYSYQRASQDLQFFLLIFNFISLRQQVTNMQWKIKHIFMDFFKPKIVVVTSVFKKC